nr:MAG: hypothetical protein [Microvirus sp.]
MKKRSKMTRKGSRKLFSKTARKSHKRNRPRKYMRGGIRF